MRYFVFILIFMGAVSTKLVNADDLYFDLEALPHEMSDVLETPTGEVHRLNSTPSRIETFTDADYRAMALRLIQVQRSMSDDYEMGDGLMFTFYIMKLFAQIGEYDLQAEEIRSLFEIFTRITEIEVPELAHTIIDQLTHLSFGRRSGDLAMSFHTINQRPIYIRLQDGETSSEMDYIMIPNGSTLRFRELVTSAQKSLLVDFMRTRIRLPLLPDSWFSRFNQIDSRAEQAIGHYLAQENTVPPLQLLFSGPVVRIRTGSSLLGDLTMDFKEAYLTPGLKDSLGMDIPALHFYLTHRMLSVKTSIAE